MLALFVLSVLTLVVMPKTVSAQGYYHRYYDPRAMILSGAISGYDCRFTTACDGYYGNLPYYRNDPRTTDPCRDDRITTVGGGALGAGGGALLGAAIGGRKGAAIGAVSGAIAGGVLASRNKHSNNDCTPTEGVQSTQPGEAGRASYQGQAPAPPAISPSASITWPTVNMTDFRAVVTDPNTGETKMVPPSASINLPEPKGDQPYTVILLAPGRGNIERISAEIRPSQDLQGWEIVARKETR